MSDRHPYASYWDRGVSNVPDMTGARHLLDARDLLAVCEALGIDVPLLGVLDIGCGTGRLSQLCDGYLGADISASSVDYCKARGLSAYVIGSINDVVLSPDPTQWVTCISVFTHIDRDERIAYMQRFEQLAPNVLVDIIPGDGSGAVEVWTAEPNQFEADCDEAGFDIVKSVDHAWDMHTHRYYRLRRKA